MAKEEWGIKRQCLSCGARFYDLKKKPIVCIKCETVFVPEPLLKSRRWQGGAKPAPDKPVVAEAETEKKDVADQASDEEEVEDDGASATLIANDDDDDDDDLSDVVTGPVKTETDG